MLYFRATLSLTLLLTLAPVQAFAASDLQQGVDELTQQIADVMKSQGKTTIAVVEFVDLNGEVNQFGQLLAEKLITNLFTHSPGQFRIVERRQLMRVIAEQELSVGGLIDKKSIGKIASTLGVDALVTGSLSPFGNIVEINARCISVESAMVFAAAATTVPNTDDVADLMTKPGSYSGIAKGPRKPPKNPKAPASGIKHGADGYAFVFERCVRAGSRVTCHFQASSEKDDRILYTFARYESRPNMTRLFDNLGNEYKASQAVLGTSQSADYTTKSMVSGISIPASFVFENFADEATHISVLQIGYEGEGSRKYNFKIRNIEFEN